MCVSIRYPSSHSSSLYNDELKYFKSNIGGFYKLVFVEGTNNTSHCELSFLGVTIQQYQKLGPYQLRYLVPVGLLYHRTGTPSTLELHFLMTSNIKSLR